LEIAVEVKNSTAKFAERGISPISPNRVLSLSRKGDTEGFIRGTAQGISPSNSTKSFQFGAKS
jgi:hypothetical protein